MKIRNKSCTLIVAPNTEFVMTAQKDKEFFEYKDGQLLEIAEAGEDSLLTWDEWQHVQAMMGMEIPLDMSIRFVGILWENDIEVLELKTDNSEQYYKKLEELLTQLLSQKNLIWILL